MVRVLYVHVKELDSFANYGMPAVMRGIMNNYDYWESKYELRM